MGELVKTNGSRTWVYEVCELNSCNVVSFIVVPIPLSNSFSLIHLTSSKMTTAFKIQMPAPNNGK